MKKKALKLRLSRETVGSLDAQKHLAGVVGGSTAFDTCESVCIGMCNPSQTECVTRCLACPQDPPSYWC